MGLNKIVVFIAIGAAAAGLLVGGLIGHFATSPTPNPATASTVVDRGNKPDPAKDESNRKFLFDKASPEEIKKTLKEYSSKPHLAGSDRNNELGNMVESTWKGYGFETKKDVFNVLLSYPGGPGKRNRAYIYNSTGAEEFASQEVEKPLVDNADPAEIVPPFNGYAKAGEVRRSKAFYVNYCRAEDFEYMTVTKNFNLTDALVICRYGKIFRGNKVKLAQQNGAVGVILYNDPQDNVDLDRYNATYNDTFPNSWFLPPSGVERGSIMDYSGDPLSPGFPSKEYAFRRTVEDVRKDGIIPNIPTQPVGYDDAKKFLRKLGGDEVEASWKGRLNDITYKYGGDLPDDIEFEIKNFNTDEQKDITNVFGIIKGSEEPDRYVLIGNHRDAWMNGATDAISGTSIMMEASRAFYELMKTGWRPRRSIIFCSWDGEEYGIIGSVEWLDEVRVLMAARAVVYLNCDSGVVYNQVLKTGASPVMHKLMYDTAKMVPLPDSPGKTIYDQWLEAAPKKDAVPPKPSISDLGSGSDHTGFYHRHGITSMDVVYHYDKKQINITAYYPLYHTSYDTFENVANYVDKEFTYHRALCQFFLEITRSIADSVMIPFITNEYAVRIEETFKALDGKVRAVLEAKDPKLAESLDYLNSAITKFKTATAAFDKLVKELPGNNPSWSEVRRVNDQLFLLERSFLYPLGILDRKYIKHVVFAPSATDSYASAAFPGISDALYKIATDDEKAWDRVKEELTKAVYTIESATKAITTDLII